MTITRPRERFRHMLVLAAVACLPLPAFAQVAASPGTEAPAAPATPTPPPLAPILLNHPTVPDTAHLRGGDTVVTLYGIQGWAGDPARNLQSFLTDNGDRVTCQPHDGGTYTCTTPTGLDVAAIALANGAAEAVAGVPDDYRQQQTEAQSSQLGIWAGKPPAPVILQHPVVQTTAMLTADGITAVLDGLAGFSAQFYTLQLQNYIAAHGDRLSCRRQPGTGHDICLLPDGTDLGAFALTNGLARVTPDASAPYHADQATAVAAKSGIWFDPPAGGGLTTIPVLTATPNCCNYAIGDNADGISYANGVPTAVIGGEPVFFDYDALLGFGFFDVQRRWHRAPEPYLNHLERFHPQGTGLRSIARPARSSQPTAAAFHAPVFFGPGGRVGAQAATGVIPFRTPPVFASRVGGLRGGSLTPIPTGIRPGLIGPRPGFVPGTGPRGIVPFAGPRPGFAGAGGFHPAAIAAPHFGGPAFSGRR